MSFIGQEKPSLGDISHFGVKGMHWGVRHDGPPGVSSSTNRQAKKDAEEFTRAKLFYGTGAGTRRKLIKARIETNSAKDSQYKKAFDHHVAQTDLSKRADQARSERRRKDIKTSTGKGIRGTTNILNGNAQAASATTALVVGGALYAHKMGIDKTILRVATEQYRNIRWTDAKKGADFLRRAGVQI